MLDRIIVAALEALQRRTQRRAIVTFTDAELRANVERWRQEAGL